MILPDMKLIEKADGTCTIQVSSIFHNEIRELNVPHSQWKMLQGWRKYQKGSLIQDCFHFLTAEEREFMLTGMTPTEQERMYNESSSMGSQMIDE